MDTSTIGTGTYFVWAPNEKAAIAEVAAKAGIVARLLTAKATGLTRPGGYDYSGSIAEDNIREDVETTEKRYAVRVK